MEFVFKLRTYGFAEMGSSIWFPSLTYNGLTEIEKTTGRVLNIYKYPGHHVSEPWRYSRLIRCGKCLVSIPFWSEDIAVFNIENREFTILEIDEEYKTKKQGGASLCAVNKGDCVFIFPAFLRCVIKVDLLNMSLSYITSGLEKVLGNIANDQIIFRQQAEVDENKVSLGLASLGGYAEFDLISERFTIHHLGETGGVVTYNRVNGISYLGAWDEKKIYQLDYDGRLTCIDEFPGDFVSYEYTIAHSLPFDKYIYYFPFRSNMILRFDTETKIIENAYDIDNSHKKDENLFTYALEKNKIITDDYSGIYELVCNESGLLFNKLVKFDMEYNAHCIKEYLCNNGFFELAMEAEGFGVDRFLTILTENLNEG